MSGLSVSVAVKYWYDVTHYQFKVDVKAFDLAWRKMTVPLVSHAWVGFRCKV